MDVSRAGEPGSFQTPSGPALAGRFTVRESGAGGPRPPKLLDQVRLRIRARHYSPATEKTYLHWIRRFIRFHGLKHPAAMGEEEIGRFLSALAERGKVSASTQNQALSAILFLYREVLDQKIRWVEGVVRAKRPRRLPVVLTRREVQAVLQELAGAPRLMATLMYGAGLRLLECCRLRVKDVDFGQRQILVRAGKGDKDRITLLPAALLTDLGSHIDRVRKQHSRDLPRGAGWVELPGGLARKYPNAGRERAWQWV
ncbi:MAG: integron integrase, partial [Acidobacteria bacterium]|nr:integron integrase [Acidobacteriota bacterium]